MALTIALTAEPRSKTGKGPARRARAENRVPAVIYGRGREAQSLTVDALALELTLKRIDTASTVIDLTIDGTQVKTLIREVQRHPVRRNVVHVDFYEIHAGERIKLRVAIHFVGSPEGVRNSGGVLDQVTREVEIAVMPDHIPERVEVDVTDLAVGQSLHVRDLEIPNATILSDPEQTICTVVPPRVEEVAAPVAEEEEAAETAEPELIGKPKPEEEGEGEAEGEEASS